MKPKFKIGDKIVSTKRFKEDGSPDETATIVGISKDSHSFTYEAMTDLTGHSLRCHLQEEYIIHNMMNVWKYAHVPAPYKGLLRLKRSRTNGE